MRVRIIDGPHEGRWLEFAGMPERTIQLLRGVRLPVDPAADPARRVNEDGSLSFSVAMFLYATEVYEIGWGYARAPERDPVTRLWQEPPRVYWYRWREPRIAMPVLAPAARIDPARWFAPTGKEGD